MQGWAPESYLLGSAVRGRAAAPVTLSEVSGGQGPGPAGDCGVGAEGPDVRGCVLGNAAPPHSGRDRGRWQGLILQGEVARGSDGPRSPSWGDCQPSQVPGPASASCVHLGPHRGTQHQQGTGT